MNHRNADKPKAKRNTDVVPKEPVGLGSTGARIWTSVWKSAYWLNDEIDYEAVARYCRYHDMRAELQATINNEGTMSTGSKDQPVTHPAISSMLALDGHLARVESQLGLNPQARSTMGIVKEEAVIDDDLAEFMSRS